MARSYRRSREAAIGVFLAGLVAAIPVAAPSAPDLELLLDEMARSLSATRDVREVRALRVEATVEVGGQSVGRVVTIARRDPRALSEVLDMAGIRQSLTLLGDEVWIRDANGTTRRASGDEVITARLAHTLLFHTYLDGDSDELELRPASDGLEFRSPPGDSTRPRGLRIERVETDGGSLLLPREWSQRQHGIDVVTTFEDWRPVDGIRFPLISKQSTGDPRFDMTLRTDVCEVLDELPEDIAIPVSSEPDFEMTDADSAADIPLELVRNLALLPVRVNGRTGSFLLDTGAGATVIDASFAESLDLSVRGVLEARGAGGSEPGSFVNVESLRLPGVVLRGQTLVALSLDAISKALGRSISGILGYDFLSRFAVEIDYGQARLALAPSGGYDAPDEAVRVRLRIESNVPRVEGRLEGKHQGSFLIDTGNSRGLLIHSPFARAHGFDDRPSRGDADVSGIGGRESMREISVRSLTLGDTVFHDVRAFVSDSAEGIVAIDEAIGNVGGALFAGGVLAFDYRAESLWIQSPSSASASDR
jgi:predicted aspartyl protease